MSLPWSNVRARSIAVMATLHAGIEPSLLALLTDTGAMPAAAGGWVVGAGQLGMSAGALICWRSSMAARRPAALFAAALGTAASLGLAVVSSMVGVLLLRLVLGGAMGLMLARATATAARTDAHRSIGMILLGQQLLATIVMVALPLVAVRWSVSTALMMIAAVPLAGGLLVSSEPVRTACASPRTVHSIDSSARMRRPANLTTMAFLIAITLMAWSYMGAIGAQAGVSGHVAVIAIAIASLASAPAALLALLTTPRQEPWITALVCGVGILSPLLLPTGAGLSCYVVAMILFNAGSTFALIRFSAWTMEGCASARERRLVVLVQCSATAGGGPLGAVAFGLGGPLALAALAAACVVPAVLAPLMANHGLPKARGDTVLAVR